MGLEGSRLAGAPIDLMITGAYRGDCRFLRRAFDRAPVTGLYTGSAKNRIVKPLDTKGVPILRILDQWPLVMFPHQHWHGCFLQLRAAWIGEGPWVLFDVGLVEILSKACETQPLRSAKRGSNSHVDQRDRIQFRPLACRGRATTCMRPLGATCGFHGES